MDDRYIRTAYLIGDAGIEKLRHASVIIFGIGGVGSYCAEALARAGIGRLTLVDKDTVSRSNINRQIIALLSTVGEYKTEVMKRRIADINPDCEVTTVNTFYLPDNADSIDLSGYDYIVDAVDNVSAKIELAVRASALGVPIISCMGTGNKLHPEMLEVSDIYSTSVCPLARVMRRELKSRGIKKLNVVYSREEPIQCRADIDNIGDKRLPGSISFVPSAAGLLIASVICREIVNT